ncbi:MAG: glycosyltransferase family 4 protein [Limisphaerales bacterium]
MNISVFSHYFTPEIGAPSARIHDMSRQWLAADHAVDVVTCFPNHPTGKLYPGYEGGGYQLEDMDGLRVHRNWTYITPNKGFLKKSLGHLSYLPSARWHSIGKLTKPDVTMGTSPTFFAAMAAAKAARKYRVPFIMEVRDLWPACFVDLGVLKQPTLIKLLEKWELSLYRQADRVVTVTESFREDLIRRGIPAKKVATIYNGADEDFWQPQEAPQDLREKHGLEGKFVALYIGAHGISQALGRVVDAAEQVKDIKDLHFLFVGEGAEKEQLKQQAKDAKLNNITFVDPVGKDEVKAYYALSDVCLVPLRNIPLFNTFIPSKMFEMMAMEKPILASLEGEAADILDRSGGAKVVPPEDSKAMAAQLRELHQGRSELGKMGKAGREFVIKEFSRRMLAAKYVEVMRDAIQEKNAR